MKLKKRNFFLKSTILKVIFSIIIETVLFFILFYSSYHIVSLKVWQKTDVVYIILKFLEKIIVPVWILVIIFTLLYYWYKSLKSVSKIELETQRLLENDDNLVMLPKELENIQESINSVKLQSIENKKKAMIEEKDKNELIAFLAHDLKTPLTLIIGYLDLLLGDSNFDDLDKKKYLNLIMEKSVSMEQLINELFDIAKFNLDNFELNLECFNLYELIESIVKDFSPLLLDKDKDIIIKNHSSISVKGDYEKLSRAFSNLIKNAISYSPKNSKIYIRFLTNETNVKVTIKNQCENITAKDLNCLFDKFYRCDKSRNSETGGHGLGLFICKKIVEYHNGNIEVNYKNKIISFVISLPILTKI